MFLIHMMEKNKSKVKVVQMIFFKKRPKISPQTQIHKFESTRFSDGINKSTMIQSFFSSEKWFLGPSD